MRATGRRLQEQRLCAGSVRSTSLQTTFFNAEIHLHHFDSHATIGLWGTKPLLGQPRPGALRLRCSYDDLQTLRSAYSGLALEPLMRATRSHNGKRPFAPLADGVALLVLPDYDNLFHQFGSFVIAWAAFRESIEHMAPPGDGTQMLPLAKDEVATIFMLNNASLRPTASFWSSGIGSFRFVRATGIPQSATYRRLICVQPATETWWWNVWSTDDADRRPIFTPLVGRLLSKLLSARDHEGQLAIKSSQRAIDAASLTLRSHVVGRASAHAESPLALFATRPAGSDRRILNDNQLASALQDELLDVHMTVRMMDLGKLSTREQLAVVRRAGVLIGAHGAALLWNLFLSEGAPLVELLNMANANQYYANHCRWMRRPYASWQNNESSAEEPALDPITNAHLAPFRNHMRVRVSDVTKIVRNIVTRQGIDVR